MRDEFFSSAPPHSRAVTKNPSGEKKPRVCGGCGAELPLSGKPGRPRRYCELCNDGRGRLRGRDRRRQVEHPDERRVCQRCRVQKPVAAFRRVRGYTLRSAGWGPVCRACEREEGS